MRDSQEVLCAARSWMQTDVFGWMSRLDWFFWIWLNETGAFFRILFHNALKRVIFSESYFRISVVNMGITCLLIFFGKLFRFFFFEKSFSKKNLWRRSVLQHVNGGDSFEKMFFGKTNFEHFFRIFFEIFREKIPKKNSSLNSASMWSDLAWYCLSIFLTLIKVSLFSLNLSNPYWSSSVNV